MTCSCDLMVLKTASQTQLVVSGRKWTCCEFSTSYKQRCHIMAPKVMLFPSRAVKLHPLKRVNPLILYHPTQYMRG